MTLTKETKKKCELYLDHRPTWAGDGFFCSECMKRFVLASEISLALAARIEELLPEGQYSEPDYRMFLSRVRRSIERYLAHNATLDKFRSN